MVLNTDLVWTFSKYFCKQKISYALADTLCEVSSDEGFLSKK